jgi:hypothetical protein
MFPRPLDGRLRSLRAFYMHLYSCVVNCVGGMIFLVLFAQKELPKLQILKAHDTVHHQKRPVTRYNSSKDKKENGSLICPRRETLPQIYERWQLTLCRVARSSTPPGRSCSTGLVVVPSKIGVITKFPEKMKVRCVITG